MQVPLFENRPESGEDLCSPWESALDLAIAIPSDHKEFMLKFRKGNWNFLFSTILQSLVVHRAEPNIARVTRMYSGSALNIVDRLMTPSWHIQVGSASALPPDCRASIETAREQLTGLLIKRNAVQREWLGGKLITRPSAGTGLKTVSSKRHSPLSSAGSDNSTVTTESTITKQRSKVRSLWTKFAA